MSRQRTVHVEDIRFDGNGLVPAIVQEASTGQVLMLAYMNRASLQKTIDTGYTWFFSRSRQNLWQKGESSGNVQRVVALWADCDQDALHVQVEQVGDGACHTGEKSCFHRPIAWHGAGQAASTPGLDGVGESLIADLYGVIQGRKEDPVDGSYTTYLFREGIDKILKKVGEESAEVLIAAKGDNRDEVVAESADLLYHLLVLLAQLDLHPDALWAELGQRRGGGGGTDIPPEK